MSILINGMKMPKDREIYLRIDEKGEVYVYGSYPTELYKAVPVPPHGRLIDADELETDLKRQCKEVFRTDAVSPDDYWITRNQAYNENLWKTWCESFYDYLKTMPIIIPTEESE